MDFSDDQPKPDRKRSRSFLALLLTVRGFIEGLIGFFTLTEEERIEAGVVIGNQRRGGQTNFTPHTNRKMDSRSIEIKEME